MLPADECLKAREAGLAVEGDLGLIVNAQLGALDGLTQGLLELETLGRAVPRALVEELKACSAPFLGPVHGGVGVADDRVGSHRGVGHDGDPDADCHRHLALAEHQRLGGGTADPVRDQHRLTLGLELLEQEGEFVAPEPRDRVHRPQHRVEAIREDREEQVTRRVAHRVVDLLESVDVEKQDGDGCPGAAGTVQGNGQAVDEQRAVGKSCQRVVQRLVGELDLRSLALDGVAHGAGEQTRVQLRGAQEVLGAGLDGGQAPDPRRPGQRGR